MFKRVIIGAFIALLSLSGANAQSAVRLYCQNTANLSQWVPCDGTNPLAVSIAGGTGVESVNLSQILGAAPSLTNPLWVFPATGATFPISGTVQIGNTPNTTPILTQSSFTPNNITTATTTVVKSGAGVLHGVTVNTKGTVASTTTIYDNTAGSGTKIAVIDSLTLSGSFFYDAGFTTGLTIVTTGTVAPDITVLYR